MAKSELLYGLHCVEAALSSRPETVLELMIQLEREDERIIRLLAQARDLGVSVQRVKCRKLDQMLDPSSSQRVNHQGVIAVCRIQVAANEGDLDKHLDSVLHPPLLLLLDSVSDPQNLGACLRVADGVGVDAVITTKDRAVGMTPVVRRVASGAAESVPFFQVTNLTRTMKSLQDRGIFIVGTDLGDEAKSLYSVDLQGPLALVMGAEGKGLRRLVRESADQLVFLPMKGSVQSLNVATAAGVCLYEALRQRS